MLRAILLKIKRKETPFYAFVYDVLWRLKHFSVPSVKFIHGPLYMFSSGIKIAAAGIVRCLWTVPLFKSQCAKVGSNLSLPDGMPLIIGSHLQLELGDNVTIHRSTLGASKVYDHPVLRIGNHTAIGYLTTFSVSKEIVIGENCLISFNCLIMDSDDHPLDPVARARRIPVSKQDVAPVKIGDNVWIGAYCAILKGVTIGNNAVIASHSVVTSDVPENAIYAGVPARFVSSVTTEAQEPPQ